MMGEEGNGEEALERLMDGSFIRLSDIRAIRPRQEELSGGLKILPRVVFIMERNIGDVIINFSRYEEAVEYCELIAEKRNSLI
jgi:hypothetical protein